MFFVSGLVQGKGQDAHGLRLVERFLACRIKKTKAFQRITEKFQAQRLFVVDSKDIDNVAAHRKMAPPFNKIHPFIPIF